MDTPNQADFLAATQRRLFNVSRSLELIARVGRGHLPEELLAAIWAAQGELARAVPQDWPAIPRGF